MFLEPELTRLRRRVHGTRREAGFTLIEMMIVVALIALLGGVALPVYQDSLRKARRSEARIALITASQMLERYNTENNTYVDATFGDGASAVYKNRSENGYYKLTLPAADLGVRTFIVNAVPDGSQAKDDCGTFTIDAAGVRGVTGGTKTAADCW